MLVCCPKCKSQYNIDDSLISELEKKARCYKCETIFSLRLRKKKITEERVATHAGGADSWEKEPEIPSESSLAPADISEQPPDNAPFTDQLDQLEITEDLKNRNDVYVDSREAGQIEDFFSDIEDLTTPPDNVQPEPSQGNLALPTTPCDEQSPENLAGDMEELLGELSDFPKVSKSGIILEEDVDQAISSETGESAPEDELDQLLNESEISSQQQQQSDDNLSEPPAQEEEKDRGSSGTEEPETLTALQNEPMPDTGSQDSIDQILQDAKNTGENEPDDEKKSKAQEEVKTDDSPETVSNDDIDAILQQAKSDAEKQTDSQDSIDQILQDAKNVGENKDDDEKSKALEEVKEVKTDDSPETVSNDDIDAILQQAKSDAEKQTDSQDSIDQILQDAKNAGENKDDDEKSKAQEEVKELKTDDSPETVSNDDIDAILQQAKSDAEKQTDSQDSIDQILQDAKGDSAEPQKEIADDAASDNGILTEDMLSELLSGDGAQDPGGMLQEEADKDAESIGDGDDSNDSADNTTGEEEAGDSSGDILSESDLESLLSGDGGEDPGFMTEETPEATDDTATIEQADDIPEEADTTDDLDQTVVSDSSERKEEDPDMPDMPDMDEDNDFHEESDEDIDDEGEGKKKKMSFKLLFFPFINIWLLFSAFTGRLLKKKRKSDEDEDDEVEDEDEIVNVEGDDEDDEEDEDGDSKRKKSNKKKRYLKAKYIMLFFAACAILAGASFYFMRNQPETPPPEETEQTVDASTEKETLSEPTLSEPTLSEPTLSEPTLSEPTSPSETETQEVPKLEEMAKDSDTVNMGLVLPIYRDPGNFKVLDMIIKIIFDSSKTASRVRDNLPYYEMKIEEAIDLFFSDKFYNDIPFVKNRLRKALKTDISKMVKFGKVKKVRIKFIKIQKREPDIEESKEGE